MATKKTKAPVSPTHKADKKRAEILKAAGKCFRRTGFHLASMQEICTETELGPGAVYRYFPSKDAIIEAMAEAERSQARAILSTIAPAADIQASLAAISHALFERYRHAQDAGMMTEVYAEGLRNKKVGSLVRKSESQWVDDLVALLDTARSAGQLDPAMDVRHTALFLTALWDGMVIRHAYHLDDKTPELEAFFDGMLRKLLLPAAGAVPEKRVKPSTTPAPAAAAEAIVAAEPDTRQLSLI